MFVEFQDDPLVRLWCWAWQMKPLNIFRSLSTSKAPRARRKQNLNVHQGDLCSNLHIGTLHSNRIRELEEVVDFLIKEAAVEVVVAVIRVVLEVLDVQILLQEVWEVQVEDRGSTCTMVGDL